jgi:hypothetical protein
MLKNVVLTAVITTMSASIAMAKGSNPVPPPDTGCDFKKACAAPEMDSSSAAAAITLLAGGLAVMIGARSKRAKAQAG